MFWFDDRTAKRCWRNCSHGTVASTVEGHIADASIPRIVAGRRRLKADSGFDPSVLWRDVFGSSRRRKSLCRGPKAGPARGFPAAPDETRGLAPPSSPKAAGWHCRRGGLGPGVVAARQNCWMPAAWIAAPIFAVRFDELLQVFRRALGGRRHVATMSLKRSCTHGVSRVAPIAALSFRTIGSGVPFGKNRPNQVRDLKIGQALLGGARQVGNFRRALRLQDGDRP